MARLRPLPVEDKGSNKRLAAVKILKCRNGHLAKFWAPQCGNSKFFVRAALGKFGRKVRWTNRQLRRESRRQTGKTIGEVARPERPSVREQGFRTKQYALPAVDILLQISYNYYIFLLHYINIIAIY